ncbi:UNVERIFIED_CONTAM: hypothetical protein Scaly_3017400 [Sesamum calycinum]|uniref:Uncharacterized protein n=1 Tax=Sesamum calycinum TaxID=2727403 RepID=A0AAW2KDV3_9LAMI
MWGVNPSSSISLTHEESDEPRRSKRARVVKDFGSDFITYNIEDDPVIFKDAMASSEAKQWKEAVKSEMDSIVSNGTLVLVDLHLGCITIGSFLYGELEEKIYMDQPEGFVAHGSERKGTKVLEGHGVTNMHYGRLPAVLKGYSDASWIAKKFRSNGSLGCVFTLGGGVVYWKYAKQMLITRSTFEAELCVLDTTGTEAELRFGLLSQLLIVSQPLPPIAVHCDSQTTIAKVRSRKYNQKTKRHIQVRLKSIRALVSDSN